MTRNLNAVLLGVCILLLTLFGHAPVYAATLTSIEVTPNDPSINISETQPFAATGILGPANHHFLRAARTMYRATNNCGSVQPTSNRLLDRAIFLQIPESLC